MKETNASESNKIIRPQDNIINVKASEIIKIFASPENRHSFAIENSNIFY